MDRDRYEPVIGLEIHAELKTRTKMFCGCSADHVSTTQANTLVCPVCVALPGAMPALNKEAMNSAILVGLALNCEINPVNSFARKNYFYPDLPKGYQISQYDQPVASHGWQEIFVNDPDRRVRIGIRRVHLEEDTAKLTHAKDGTLVDFNRAGVPLLEIVTDPEMHSVDSVVELATKLRTILRYLNVNSGDMEKGILRFEANVSLRLAGSSQLNTRTEIKNLNSFRALARSIQVEILRQTEIYSSGGQVLQETLGWDEAKDTVYSQRGKEEAHDYRYFPEPDIPPITVGKGWVDEIHQHLPELPDARVARFVNEFGLTYKDAWSLCQEKAMADYFEKATTLTKVPPKVIYNWVSGEFTKNMNEMNIPADKIPVSPEHLATLLEQNSQKMINDYATKEVLAEMFATNGDPREIIKAKGLNQISDEGELKGIVQKVIEENPKEVALYRNGKTTLFAWFMGQVSKATNGNANPQIVRVILSRHLDQQQ